MGDGAGGLRGVLLEASEDRRLFGFDVHVDAEIARENEVDCLEQVTDSLGGVLLDQNSNLGEEV